jgi:hypothetical protein
MTDTAAATTHIKAAQRELDLALEALEGGTPTPPPPIYASAIQDRDVREKPALPVLGPAGSSLTDPCFGTTITRVTDAVLADGSSWRVASNAHVASWNADASRFYLIGQAGKQIFALEGGAVRPFAKVSSQCEPTFSRSDPARLYAVGGPVTRTVQAVPLEAAGVGDPIELLDLDTLGLPDLVEPRTYVGGMVTSDISIAIFFGGAGQDAHHYAGVLLEGAADFAYLIDTLAEPGLGFKLHSIAIDHSGRFVVLYPVQAKPFHMVIWDLEHGTFTPVTEAPWGHDTQGYGIEINHDTAPNGQEWDAAQWVIRPLDQLDTCADLITPVLRPKEVYLDDHASWHNARPDSDGPSRPVITATYRYNNEACPWRAWDDEVIAIATAGPSIVYRFCHHRSDARDEGNPAGTYFWYQPIPSVSPDGRFVLFTSNWEKTLGPDPGDAGRSRQDVFLVELPA